MEIVSRVGKILVCEERVYALLSDFTNLGTYVPSDKVQDFKSDTDSCSFKVDKIGNFGMRITERTPFKLVKICNDENIPYKFKMWIQLKTVNDNDVRVKITLRADLNPMLKVMAKKPLTKFVNTMVNSLESIR